MVLSEDDKKQIKVQKILAGMVAFLMEKYDFQRDFAMFIFNDPDETGVIKTNTVSNMDINEIIPILRTLVDEAEKLNGSYRTEDLKDSDLEPSKPVYFMGGESGNC